MKRHHKAFWIALRAAVAALLCWLASPAMAAADGASNAYTVSSTSSGPVIRFSDFDWVMDTGFAIPAGGWTRGPAERLWSLPELHSQAGDYRAVFARFRFDRAALGQGPLALFTQDNREQVLIYVNGVDLFRNFARADDKVQAWYRPYLVPVPERLLHPGVNEIVMRVGTNYDLKVGPVMLGPDDALRPIFERQHFWRVAAPSAANYVMLAIGGIALLLWARRRREWELLFVALTAVLWFAVDYHYVADVLPFDQTLYSAMSNYGIYFAMWASYSFCWLFVDAPHKWRLIWAMLAFGVIILALRLADLIATKGFFLAMIGMSGFTALLAWQGLRSSRAIEHRLVAYVLAIGIAASIHDLGRVAEVHWWQGLDFYFLPFTGLVFCLMFLFFFLRRAMAAFTALEDVNHTLEARVAEARSELVAS